MKRFDPIAILVALKSNNGSYLDRGSRGFEIKIKCSHSFTNISRLAKHKRLKFGTEAILSFLKISYFWILIQGSTITKGKKKDWVWTHPKPRHFLHWHINRPPFFISFLRSMRNHWLKFDLIDVLGILKRISGSNLDTEIKIKWFTFFHKYLDLSKASTT